MYATHLCLEVPHTCSSVPLAELALVRGQDEAHVAKGWGGEAQGIIHQQLGEGVGEQGQGRGGGEGGVRCVVLPVWLAGTAAGFF